MSTEGHNQMCTEALQVELLVAILNWYYKKNSISMHMEGSNLIILCEENIDYAIQIILNKHHIQFMPVRLTCNMIISWNNRVHSDFV